MHRLLACLLLLLPVAARAQSGPIVVELFTSQGCSSCPPAEAFLTEMARTRPDLLPLAFHVTYWDQLGWRDPFSLPEATERQRAYAALRDDHQVFTPEMVVQGQGGLVGSDRVAVARAIAGAEAHRPPAPDLVASRDGTSLAVQVGAGMGPAFVLAVGFDSTHRTPVGRGENAGVTLAESNVVRALTMLGRWTGQPVRLQGSLPAGEHVAVLLQAPDGIILAASQL
jgi:hypothetical protein